MIYKLESKKEFHDYMNQYFKLFDLGIVFTGTDLFSDANMSTRYNQVFIAGFASHNGFEGDIVDLKEFYEELPYRNPSENKEVFPQVDFYKLRNMLRPGLDFGECSLLYCNPTQEELSNLALFFDMMKKSSSFAHLSHKKLQ